MSSSLKSFTSLIFAIAWPVIALPLCADDEAPAGGDSLAKKREMWDSLTLEEKEKLKNALREVWTDPAVITAREEVRQASEAYQAAIHEAVQRVDPGLAGLVKKAQAFSAGSMKERVGGGPPGARGGIMMRRSIDYPMSPPGFLEKLTPEEQEKFREAEIKAKESEEVQAAMKVLKDLQRQDETQRRKRLEAHRKMRASVLRIMVELDPSLEEIQKRLEISASHRPDSGRKGVDEKSTQGAKATAP